MVLVDVQIQNLQGIRAHGCWVGVIMWTHTHSFIGFDYLAKPRNQKYHGQRIYISGNQQQQCKFLGWKYFIGKILGWNSHART